MLNQGVVGSQRFQDSSTPATMRMGQQGDVIVSELHGRYYEQSVRGRMFVLDSDSITLAAANATKSAAGTIKLVNGFYNPVGSGVNAVITFAKVATVSGTPAGGYFYNVQNMSTGLAASVVATGTARPTIQSQLVNASSAMFPLVNVVVSRLDAATTAFTQLAAMGGPTAVAATGAVEDATDEPAGRIVIGPGFAFGIAATGAGTSHVVQSTLFWEEVPIIL